MINIQRFQWTLKHPPAASVFAILIYIIGSVAGIYCSALFLYYSRPLLFRQRSFQKQHERLYTKTIENNACVIHKHYSYYYDSISITSGSVEERLVHRLNIWKASQSCRPVPVAFVLHSFTSPPSNNNWLVSSSHHYVMTVQSEFQQMYVFIVVLVSLS